MNYLMEQISNQANIDTWTSENKRIEKWLNGTWDWRKRKRCKHEIQSLR